jgi:hypothetical protein
VTLRASTAVLSARYDGGVMQFLDWGPDPARLRIFSGPRPATLALAALTSGATLLHELPLAKPCGTVADGKLTLQQAAEQPLILASGEAAWAMLVNGESAIAFDMDCTLPGGGGEVELSTLALYAGGTVLVTLAELS